MVFVVLTTSLINVHRSSQLRNVIIACYHHNVNPIITTDVAEQGSKILSEYHYAMFAHVPANDTLL